MRESGYYAPGTEFSSDAPWNEVSVPEKTFDVYCSETLSKTVSVDTDDYEIVDDEVNTFETDWTEAYNNNEHYTPSELIKELRSLAYDNYRKGYYDNEKEKLHLLRLMEECVDWYSDDLSIGDE